MKPPASSEAQIQLSIRNYLAALGIDAVQAVFPASLLPLLFDCDFETGRLFWRERTPAMFPHCQHPKAYCSAFNKQFAGKEAFTANNKGYRVGRIYDRIFQAHRIVFALAHGRWPIAIDHIDGNGLNNSIHNLREASQAENCRNLRRARHNTSGITGVCFDGRRGKWFAQIRLSYRNHFLGYFSTKEEAAAARAAADQRFDFHPNHGRAA